MLISIIKIQRIEREREREREISQDQYFFRRFDIELIIFLHFNNYFNDYSNLQAVVVGYFNFTRLDRTPGYREFYKAAIRSLERDPNRELVFAIVTSSSSSKLHYGVYKFPSANLLMWNESLVSMQCANFYSLSYIIHQL